MSSKTKIVVLHMKEVIYTGIFLLLLVILGVVSSLCLVPANQKQGHLPMPFQNIRPESTALLSN